VIGAEHGWGLAVFPLGAALIAAAFGVQLTARFLSRRRPHEGVWAVALFMYAAASLAMVLGVAGGWRPGQYRVYWLFGAALNVPFLAQGELYLLIRWRTWAHIVLGALALVALGSAAIVWTEAVRAEALDKALPLGREAWGSDSSAYQLRWLSWIGYFALLAGLAWSAYGMRGRRELRDRAVGTLLIALGATVVAVGSGVGAGFDVVSVFSTSLAVGIAIMYWGFLRASRRSPRPTAEPSPRAA
jgi:hypothetical protein